GHLVAVLARVALALAQTSSDQVTQGDLASPQEAPDLLGGPAVEAVAALRGRAHRHHLEGAAASQTAARSGEGGSNSRADSRHRQQSRVTQRFSRSNKQSARLRGATATCNGYTSR